MYIVNILSTCTCTCLFYISDTRSNVTKCGNILFVKYTCTVTSVVYHTSSSVLNGTTQVTGPNISSCMRRLSSETFVITVGLMK